MRLRSFSSIGARVATPRVWARAHGTKYGFQYPQWGNCTFNDNLEVSMRVASVTGAGVRLLRHPPIGMIGQFILSLGGSFWLFCFVYSLQASDFHF